MTGIVELNSGVGLYDKISEWFVHIFTVLLMNAGFFNYKNNLLKTKHELCKGIKLQTLTFKQL
jgi:hypothetical protein